MPANIQPTITRIGSEEVISYSRALVHSISASLQLAPLQTDSLASADLVDRYTARAIFQNKTEHPFDFLCYVSRGGNEITNGFSLGIYNEGKNIDPFAGQTHSPLPEVVSWEHYVIPAQDTLIFSIPVERLPDRIRVGVRSLRITPDAPLDLVLFFYSLRSEPAQLPTFRK